MSTLQESPVVEKLSSLLEQKPTNYEITILPVATDQDVLSLDESLQLIEGQHLGLDARSLPWMTQEIRKTYKRQRNQKQQPKQVLRVTACLLLVNPDHATAWADRRRSLLALQDNDDDGDEYSNGSNRWKEELEFLNLLMSQHSKAPSSWGHRKYVLQKYWKDIKTDTIKEQIQKEIHLCRRVAEKYPKNYYAWTHRRYIWNLVEQPECEWLQEEWKDIVLEWLPLHVSDHSAAHYGSQILLLWMAALSSLQPEALATVASEAILHTRTLIQRQEDHETLWILRRLVVRILSKYASDNKNIQALVLEDIATVASNCNSKVQKDNDENTKDRNVHALTFLAWCYEAIDTSLETDECPPSRQDTVDIKGLLRSHPQVHHRMWIL